jgi:hypothetical protein
VKPPSETNRVVIIGLEADRAWPGGHALIECGDAFRKKGGGLESCARGGRLTSAWSAMWTISDAHLSVSAAEVLPP